MKNSVSVCQLVEEFAEQFCDIMSVTRDENESRIAWFFENNYNGSQFVIIYDHSNSLHHRDGIHIDLPIDIDSLNYVVDCALRQGVSMIYVHNQSSLVR